MHRSAAVLLMLALVLASAAMGGMDDVRPVLRIEAGMDTGTIWRIATDRSGRWAATASDDKTARVWELPSGKLRMVLRPPIWDGNGGKLFAVAMSPDATLVAVSGWTSADATEQPVYLFDRGSGRMVQKLGPAPNVVKHLAFSPDGRWLAAALGAGQGIAVWSVQGGKAALRSAAYGADSQQVAWSADGRLASTCYDGAIRLYQFDGRQLSELRSIRAPGGQRPLGLAFAPNGKALAVAYADTSRVDVFEGETLSSGFVANPQDPEQQPFFNVTWSSDGQNLYAVGAASRDGQRILRRWPNAGHGRAVDVPTMAEPAMGVAPLAGGGLLVAGAGPEWGMVDERDRWLRLGQSPAQDFRGGGTGGGLLLSADGRTVQFGYDGSGQVPLRFDLNRRLLGNRGGTDVHAALLRGLPVSDWVGSNAPKLDGRRLPIGEAETSLSLAVSPEGGSFALGTHWFLRRFNADGAVAWSLPAPAPVWGLNLLPGSKVLVAAYGDGTIRWHRYSDGQELLALFVHADRRRWVLWTPSGFYDASPGGDDLIGWHLNRGPAEAADFFAAARFNRLFHRPEVIDRVLDTLDERRALALADASLEAKQVKTEAATVVGKLPPVIDLLSAAEVMTDQGSVPVRLRLRVSADAPVEKLLARVNGQVAEIDTRTLGDKSAGEREVRVKVPSADSVIEVFAENRYGTSSQATVRVKWTGVVPAPALVDTGRPADGKEFRIQPNLYVLAVGVGAYQHSPIPHLDLPAKDATDFARVISGQRGKLYRNVVTRVLTDGQATKDEVMDGLDWLQKQVTQHDVGMLFLAGHGVNDPVLGYSFLPVNAEVDRLKRTAVSMADIRTTLANLVGKAVVFLDTCHAGNVLGTARRGIDGDLTGVINELASAENGVVVFSSSTGRQNSLEDPAWGNGAFTKALVEGLEGRAAYEKNGRITYKMLDLYVSERVKQLTDGQQSPVTLSPQGVPDFPLALVDH